MSIFHNGFVTCILFVLCLLVRDLPLFNGSDNPYKYLLKKRGITNIPAPLLHTFSSKVPYVADAIAYMENEFFLYVVLNVQVNVPPYEYYSNGQYSVIYNGNTYNGSRMATETCIVMKYSLPISTIMVGDTIEFTVENSVMNHTIHNCSAVVLSSKKKGGIASCSYLSNFNSMYEVIHFIAYTLLIGVDVVILYEATPVPYESALKQIFGKRVHLYSFTWPQRSNYSFPQRGSQLAQMNSCYYRNKHYFDYMIFIDVDEYLYFDNSNYTLRSIIQHFFSGYSEYGIQVSSVFSFLLYRSMMIHTLQYQSVAKIGTKHSRMVHCLMSMIDYILYGDALKQF